jgi:hypothetical protein
MGVTPFPPNSQWPRARPLLASAGPTLHGANPPKEGPNKTKALQKSKANPKTSGRAKQHSKNP